MFNYSIAGKLPLRKAKYLSEIYNVCKNEISGFQRIMVEADTNLLLNDGSILRLVIVSESSCQFLYVGKKLTALDFTGWFDKGGKLVYQVTE